MRSGHNFGIENASLHYVGASQETPKGTGAIFGHHQMRWCCDAVGMVTGLDVPIRPQPHVVVRVAFLCFLCFMLCLHMAPLYKCYA